MRMYCLLVLLEVHQAIKQLADNKAGGLDNISAEHLKLALGLQLCLPFALLVL